MAEPDAVPDAYTELLAAYLEAEEAGNAPAPAALVAAHPALAAALTDFFASRQGVPRLGIAANARLEPIGDFDGLEPIGHGAVAEVYRARQRGLNRRVAIKVLRGDRFATAAARARFRREYEQLARLEHPGIVRIYQSGEEHGRLYFAMELVEGGSLAERLAGGWLPMAREAAELVGKLAEAVAHVHTQGVYHRDLKPANVLLPATRLEPKIADFGLAKETGAAALTQTGAVLGTASYMAPEQAAGAEVDARADVYGLGAILYELLTGRPPFVGPTIDETLGQVRQDEPLPPRQLAPSVPRDLEAVCLQCLRKRPDDRYASAAALAEDLSRFLHGEPVRARHQSHFQRIATAVANPGLMQTYHAYGTSYLLAGLIFAAAHAAVFVAIRIGAPEWLIWLALLAPFALPLARFRRPRYPWTGLASWVDRHLRTVWLGHVLAVAAVLIAMRLGSPDMAVALATGYPAMATLAGFAFFLLGTDYWGRYYVFGVLWLAGAVAMALSPTWAPLEFSALALACFAQVAMYMSHMARQGKKMP